MARQDRFRKPSLADRLPMPRDRGRRDVLAIILLVVPLIAIGYYLAVIEVAVDPPPPPVATLAATGTPAATPDTAPATPTGLAPEATPATPDPVTGSARSGAVAVAILDGMVLASPG